MTGLASGIVTMIDMSFWSNFELYSLPRKVSDFKKIPWKQNYRTKGKESDVVEYSDVAGEASQ